MKKIYVLLFMGILCFTSCSNKTEETDNIQTNTPTVETSITQQKETATPTQTNSDDKKTETKSKKKTKKEKYETYLTSKIGISYRGEVSDDVTGNWYWSRTTSNKAVEKYAVKYYKVYFESDDELHAIINKQEKTTTSIQVLQDGVLDINTYTYVPYEEQSAKTLFVGDLISENLVYIKSGKVEKLQ